MAARDYADGTVLQLSGGRSELDAVLSSAAGRRQPVLVQFSAQWCGPCRMMTPVVAELARRHAGKLVAVKADIEGTGDNRALAGSLHIQSLPTFQLYTGGRVTDTLRGADRAGLQRLVESAIAAAGPARRPGEMPRSLAVELARIKAAAPGPAFMEAVHTLLRFVGNVLSHREEAKYRRVKVANPGFAAKLGKWPGGVEAMRAIGFNQRMEAAETVLVMDDVPDELETVKNLLEAAMRGAGGSAAAASQQPPAAGAAPPPTTDVPSAAPARASSPGHPAAAQAPMAEAGAVPGASHSASAQPDTAVSNDAAAAVPGSSGSGGGGQGAALSPEEQARAAQVMARMLAEMLQQRGDAPQE